MSPDSNVWSTSQERQFCRSREDFSGSPWECRLCSSVCDSRQECVTSPHSRRSWRTASVHTWLPREGEPRPYLSRFSLRRGSEAASSIPPPHRSAVFGVVTYPTVPLDAGGRWCRFRPNLLAGRSGGPHHQPGHRPAPTPSPIAGAAPRPRRSTASSGNTWRPTSPWPMSPTLWATAYRITWKRSSAAI